MMKQFLLGCLIVLGVCTISEARPRWRNTNTVSVSFKLAEGESNATAECVAKIMAKRRTVGHWGGFSSYASHEGCGMGMTKQQAYNNCCYSRNGWITVDVGYAQDVNGNWYCCRRYK